MTGQRRAGDPGAPEHPGTWGLTAGVGGLMAGVGGRLPPTLQPGCLSVPRDGTALLLEALSLRARARDLHACG